MVQRDRWGNIESRAGLTSARQDVALSKSRGRQSRGLLERMAQAKVNRVMRQSFTEATRQGKRGDI